MAGLLSFLNYPLTAIRRNLHTGGYGYETDCNNFS